MIDLPTNFTKKQFAKKENLEQVKNFLNENKKDLFIFFKKNSPYFPSHCTDICLVLHKFLKDYYNIDFEIIRATKKLFANKKNFHMYLRHNDMVIDLSLFQFYIGALKFKKTSEDDCFEYCIEEIQQNRIIFDKLFHEKLFIQEKQIEFNDIKTMYYEDINTILVTESKQAHFALIDFLKDLTNLKILRKKP